MKNNISKTLQQIIDQGMEDKVIKRIELPCNFKDKVIEKNKEVKAINNINTENKTSLKEVELLRENVETVNDLIINDFQSLKYTTLKLSKYLRNDMSKEVNDLRDIIEECNREYKEVKDTLNSIKEIVKTTNDVKNKEELKEINNNLATLVRQNKKLINLTTKMQEENLSCDEIITKSFEKWAKKHIRGFALK